MKTKLSITSLALPLLAVLLSLATVTAAQPGFISTVAGTSTEGFNGDGILATTAQLAFPVGIFVDGSGNLFIADLANHRIRKVDAATGLISTVAGTGTAGFSGDGIPATTAELRFPSDVFVDGSGNLFITDRPTHRIRKVDAATGLISTVAGTGTGGFNGDGIPATSAQLASPFGIFVDGSGNLFIADELNHRIRKVDGATGLISTVAGTGTIGFNGDGIPATTAQLRQPFGVFVDGSGNLFIADTFNQRVRKVDAATGLISTVAGTGTAGFNGDGIPANTAQLNRPHAVFVDGSGNLFIADHDNSRVRKVDGVTGLISTVAGTGTNGFNGDGISATTAQLFRPTGVFVDGSGNLFIADGSNHRIRRVEPGVADTDDDGVPDDDDLCPGTVSGDTVDANGCSDAQVDGDGDGICDAGAASDGPSACTGTDNCPDDANADQADLDGDGIGNVCDDTVNVNGAVNVLVDDIIALNLNSETALVHHLENALASFASGNENAAVNQLNAFIQHVNALSGGPHLTEAEADGLIGPVQAMIDAINSGTANLRSGEPEAVPDRYALEGNYPNPFSIHTTIRFGLPESAQVRLVVYDVLGRQVRVLLDGTREAGAHEVVFDTSDLPSGTYLYRLETPQGSYVRTMLLMK